MARTSDRLVVALSERLTTTTDRAIRTVVKHRGPAIAASGDALRATYPGSDPARLLRIAAARRSWHLAGTGAASVPGPGTSAGMALAAPVPARCHDRRAAAIRSNRAGSEPG